MHKRKDQQSSKQDKEPANKKQRTGHADDEEEAPPKKPQSFNEDEEDDDADLEDEDVDQEQDADDNAVASVDQKLKVKPLKDYWARPHFDEKKFDVKANKMIFQQMDADYYVGNQKPGYPGPASGKVPIVRLFGVTQEGNSVLCHVRGYIPYFYIEMPRGFDPLTLDEFRDNINVRFF